MAFADDIVEALEEAFRNGRSEGSRSAEQRAARTGRGKRPRRKGQEGFELAGYPTYAPLKWDDLGLGMVRSMGFMPNRAVQLKITPQKWMLVGARANSSVLLWLAAGAGGLIYLLQDLLYEIENWGWIASTAIVVLPTLLNILVPVRPLEFLPFELEFLGYDSENQILVLSTLTQPGGRVAMRLDLPSNEKIRKVEEARLIERLKKAHTGFTLINGMAKPDIPKIKMTIVWVFVWLLLFYLSITYGRLPR